MLNSVQRPNLTGYPLNILICLHEMTDRLILMYTGKKTKHLLNKLIIISTDYVDFREGQDESKTSEEEFWYFIIRLVHKSVQ